MRATLSLTALLLAFGLPAHALVDIPTSQRRALGVVDLAAGSGIAPGLDAAALPLDDLRYLRAYRALESVGLVDPLGRELAAEAEARRDGKLHLRPLLPDVELRAYWFTGADDRLLYHGSGDRLARGFNSFLSASGRGYWGERVSLLYDLQLHQEPGDLRYRTKRLSAKAVAGKWSLTVGRDSERLGPGYHGSLVLDDNAQALDMVRIRTEEPVYLPGFLAAIGGFRFTIFDAYLSEDDPAAPDPRYASGAKLVKDPLLLGMRLSYHPADWFDFGISRAIIYSGAGRERYDSPRDWWELFTASNENVKAGGTHRFDNDQYMGFDVTARMPFLNGLGPLKAGKAYWEYAYTDPPDPFVFKDKRVANLAGLYLSTGVTDLRLEYAETGESWYRHHIYGQGYSYRGLPLGHHMGGDAKDWFAEMGRYLAPAWRTTVAIDIEERGRSLAVAEKRKEVTAALESYGLKVFGIPLTVRLDLLAGRLRNPLDDPERDDRDEVYVGVGLEGRP